VPSRSPIGPLVSDQFGRFRWSGIGGWLPSMGRLMWWPASGFPVRLSGVGWASGCSVTHPVPRLRSPEPRPRYRFPDRAPRTPAPPPASRPRSPNPDHATGFPTALPISRSRLRFPAARPTPGRAPASRLRSPSPRMTSSDYPVVLPGLSWLRLPGVGSASPFSRLRFPKSRPPPPVTRRAVRLYPDAPRHLPTAGYVAPLVARSAANGGIDNDGDRK
jgi:hypothetical protein